GSGRISGSSSTDAGPDALASAHGSGSGGSGSGVSCRIVGSVSCSSSVGPGSITGGSSSIGTSGGSSGRASGSGRISGSSSTDAGPDAVPPANGDCGPSCTSPWGSGESSPPKMSGTGNAVVSARTASSVPSSGNGLPSSGG